MKNILAPMKRGENTILAKNFLSSAFSKFLLMHTCFMIFTTLPGVFINIFLLGQTGDMNVVLYYNAIFFISGAVCMALASYILCRFNSSVVVVIGILFYNLLYLILIILGSNASKYFILLGLIIGIADGFYWIGYGYLLSTCTSLENRDKGMATISFFSAVVNLLIPLLSGMIISKIGGTQGYLVVFGLAFIVAVITVIIAVLLPHPPKTDEYINYMDTFGLIKKERCLVFSLAGQSAKGIKEGIFTFILSILLFKLVKNELLIGFNTFLSAFAAIFSYAIIRRYVNRENRIMFMAIAVVVLSCYNFSVLFFLNAYTIVLFSIIDAFFTGFIINSGYSTFLDAMQVVPDAGKHRPELLVINEAVLVLGRCIGLLIMIGINLATGADMMWQVAGLLFLTLTQFLTVKLNKIANSDVSLLDMKTAA